MTIRAVEQRRPIGHHGIQVRFRRKHGRRPARLDPAASREPLAWLVLCRTPTNSLLQVRHARGAFEIEAEFAKTNARQMRMGIRQTGKDSEPVQINSTSSVRCPSQPLSIRARIGNAAIDSKNGLYLPMALIGGVNIAVE